MDKSRSFPVRVLSACLMTNVGTHRHVLYKGRKFQSDPLARDRVRFFSNDRTACNGVFGRAAGRRTSSAGTLRAAAAEYTPPAGRTRPLNVLVPRRKRQVTGKQTRRRRAQATDNRQQTDEARSKNDGTHIYTLQRHYCDAALSLEKLSKKKTV